MKLTYKQRHELLNKGLFQIFPGNTENLTDSTSVHSSFIRVITTKKKDVQPVFSYNLLIPETTYCSNINEPILNEFGEVAYIVHTTKNITEKILQQKQLTEALEHTQYLEREQALNEGLAASNEELLAINEELKLNKKQPSIT